MKIDEVLILALLVVMSVVATAAVRGADYDAALNAATGPSGIATKRGIESPPTSSMSQRDSTMASARLSFLGQRDT